MTWAEFDRAYGEAFARVMERHLFAFYPPAPAVLTPADEHIERVLEQVPSASRAQAVAALKKANGDIVSAIMELTM